jgi:hypothetical protein
MAHACLLQNPLRITWLTAMLAMPLIISNIAAADEACGETTCPTGFTCVSRESSACKDEETAAGSTVTCEAPTTYYQCEPAPCSVDTDCGEGMVCYSYTSSQCSGAKSPTCDPAAPDCSTVVTPAEPTCTTTTEQRCIPRYMLPCSTASDCGPGFTCEETIVGQCSGSGGSTGTAVSSDGVAVNVDGSGGASSTTTEATGGSSTDTATDPSVSCTNEPTGEFACKLQIIACATAADCPSGFTCVENPEGVCTSSSTGEESCTVADPPLVCMPPYADLVGRSASESDSSGQASSTGGDSVLGTKEDTDDASNNAVPSDTTSVSGSGCNIQRSANGFGANLLPLLLAAALALGLRWGKKR